MQQKYDTIIIGAGTAGLTAAIYAARRSQSVLVLENAGIGGQISTSPCVENYPGFEKISGSEFSDKLFEQALALGAKLEIETVTGIETEGTKKFVLSEDGLVRRECDKIIIATGVEHRKLGLPDEERLSGRGVSYCAVCDGAFFKNRTVAVVGGGSAALQSARLLAGLCKSVYLIHRRDEFRGEQRLAEEVAALPQITLVLSSTIEKLIGGDMLEGITVRNIKSGIASEIKLDGLFVYIGQIPNNAIFKDTIALDNGGYIIAGEDCRTSVDGIFAAGDCRSKAVRQLTTAAADGTVAALAD